MTNSQKNLLFINKKYLYVLVILLIIGTLLTTGGLLQVLQKPAKAAGARVQSTTCTNNGTTSLVCTALGAAPANGNTMIAVIGTRGTTTGRVSSITQTGATWVRATEVANSNGITMEIWYAVNVSSAGTAVTVNLAASLKASAVVAEYSGMLTASVLDQVASTTGNSTAPSTNTTATTSNAHQVWIGGMANINTSTYSAQTNSFTEVAEAASTGGAATTRNNVVMEEKIVSTTGTANVDATLSASQQWAGAIATFEAVPPPSKIVFTTAARTLTAGTCSGAGSIITIEIQNSLNTPTAPTGSTVVRVTSNSPSETIYSDSSCSTPITNGDITFTTSDTAKSFYIIDTRKSSPTWLLTAAQQSGPDTLTDGTQSITVNAAATARLQLTLPGQTFTDGTGNSGTVTNQTAGGSFTITSISSTDIYNNVTPGYSGAKTLVYSGPSNAPLGTAPTYTTSVSFTNGQSTTSLSTTLYNAQSVSITATDGGSYGYASSSLTIDPGAVANYLVSATTPNIAGTCVTGSTITARDAWNNNRTTDTSVVNMTTSGTGLTFYTAAGCGTSTTQYTMSGGTANVYFITNKKQSGITITATKNLDTPTGTSGAITINPAAASALLIRLPGQSFTDGTGISGGTNFTGLRTPNATAGTSYSVDIKAVDAYNNLVDTGPNNYTGAKTISWAGSTAGNAPSGQTPSFPGSVTFTNGSANTLSITYYNATTARTVEADDTGTPVSGTTSSSFTVQAGSVQNYAVAPSGAAQTAGTSFNVTVTARDQWNNTLGALYSAPAGSYTWTTNATNAPLGTAPSIGTLVQGDFSAGVATKSVTLYKVESGVTFTATEPSAGATGTSTTTVTVSAGLVANYLVSATTPNIAGTCVTGSTITARDAWNNNRTTDTSVVNMTTSGTGLTFYTAAGCGTSTTQYTMSGGTANVYFITNKKQSGITITATKNLDTPTGTSGAITINPAAASALLIRLPGQSFTDGTGISGGTNFTGLRTPNATAGTSYSVDIKAVDAYNNLVDTGPNNYTGAKTISWAGSTAGNAPSGQTPSFPGSVTFTNGSANTLSITYYNATTARTVEADDTGTPVSGTTSSSFTVQAGSVQNYAVAAGGSQTAGVAFNVTVTARDTYNNQLGSLYSAPAGSYIWSTTAGNAPDATTPSIGTLTQANFTNGVATKSVTLYKAESGVTFTASEPGPASTGTTSAITVAAGNVSANTSDSTISGIGIIAVNSPLAITITLKDTWQNPKVGVTAANIVVSATGTPSITQPSVNTDANGQTTADLTWTTTGARTVSVQINTITLVQNDGVTVDADGYLDNTLAVTVSPPAADARFRGGTTIRGGTTF